MREYSPTPRRGTILILVLVVIALLTLAGYTYTELMLAEYEAAMVHGRSVQAHALADSGLEMARLFLAQDPLLQQQAGGHYDNPERFQGILVIDDDTPSGRGRFTIVAPRMEEGVGGIRFGLEDESARLNINTLLLADRTAENGGRTLLMALPGMTEDVADSILDWLDPDDQSRQFGGEIDVYSSLDPPYAPRNGPLYTVEDLLLVQGVTPYTLFGPDVNRNGLVDAFEFGGEALAGVDNVDGSFDRGWAGYLTLHSQESNLDSTGQPRINVNEADLELLYESLLAAFDEETATFIVAYRQGGPYSSGGSGGGGGGSGGGGSGGGNSGGGQGPRTGDLDLTREGGTELTTILDLIGARTEVRFENASDSTILESPFGDDPADMATYLPLLMDKLTVNPEPSFPGRININQAPRALLQGIPGMTEDVVEQIMADRLPELTADNPDRRHETWLLSEGLVDLEQMRELMPFITGQGSVYRVQVVGYFEEGGPSARIEAILDATTIPPRLVFWRDMSHLGRGHSLQTLGIEY